MSKDVLRYKVSDENIVTPITKIIGGDGIAIERLKDASGTYELDEVVIKNDLSGLEVDEDVYALLQALNDEVL